VAVNCRTAGWGCIDCKKALAGSIEQELVPIRRRAEEIRNRPQIVDEALAAGAEHCRGMARQTMGEVKERMGLA